MLSTTIKLHNNVTGYLGSVILVYLVGVTEALKCFAGNPARKLECNTISYCLFITSRTGRTQWSCDGNAITQVSLCSTFGMDAPRHRIYEAPPSSRQDTFYRPPESGSSGSLYYVKQKLDSRLTPFVSDGSNSGESGDVSSDTRNGQRCFDGGQIGRVCCCDTDFCNSSLMSSPSILRVLGVFLVSVLYQLML